MIEEYIQAKYDCRRTDHPEYNCICILDSELTFIYKEDSLTISDVEIKINYLPIGDVSRPYRGVHFFDPKNILLKAEVLTDSQKSLLALLNFCEDKSDVLAPDPLTAAQRNLLFLLGSQKAINFTCPHLDYYRVFVKPVYGGFATVETVISIDNFARELLRYWQDDPFNTNFKQLPSTILSSYIRYSNGRQLYLTTPGHPLAIISPYNKSDAIDNGFRYPSFDSRRQCISHIAKYIVEVLDTILHIKH